MTVDPYRLAGFAIVCASAVLVVLLVAWLAVRAVAG